MDVELRTHSANPSLVFRNLERWEESVGDVPAGWRARLAVCSGPFSAELPFYFDETGLDAFLAAIRVMDRQLKGEARLATPREDPFVRLECASNGGVTVSGLLVEDPGWQRLSFAFGTDQTVLSPFVRDFEAARRELSATSRAT